MSRLLSKLLPRRWRVALSAWFHLPGRLAAAEDAQAMLAAHVLSDKHARPETGNPLPRHEASVYSQNGEDGILLYLFSVIGTTNSRFVEFGFGGGGESNSSNLLVNWGWRGVFMDAEPRVVEAGRRFYDSVLGPRSADVSILEAHIGRDNINAVLSEAVPEAELDLLSIDIDGNDYWVWQALDGVRPRVVVIEYSAAFGSDRSVTVPHDAGFRRFAKHRSGFYFGASLAALTKLGREKGYALVGCDSRGVNAFFVRQDVMAKPLEAIAPVVAYRPLSRIYTDLCAAEQFDLIEHLPLDEI